MVVALVLVLVAPGAVFLGVIVKDAERERRLEMLQAGEQRAELVSDRLEEEFRTLSTMLAVFASSGWLEEGHYERLHQRARSALLGSNRYLIVLDENLNQLLNTRVPFGEPLGPTSDQKSARRVLESGVVLVSDQFRGRVAGTQVFNVLRRAVLANGERRVLIMTRNASDLASLFPASLTEEGWSFAIYDGAGQLVYGTNPDPGAGQRIPEGCTSPSQEQASEGLLFRRRVDFSDWHVCVWGSNDRIQLSERSTSVFSVLIFVWFAGAVIAAVTLSILLTRSIANAARVAEALDAGKDVPATSSFIREIDEVLHSLVEAARERLRKTEELGILLRETAHRAKNQIAITSSLLSLSARSARSVEALRDDLGKRLTALGRSIDMMGGGSVDTAPLDELLEVQLRPFLNEQKELLAMAGPPLQITQSAGQSFGLVLHELATNASKYGAWSCPGGKVRIGWRVEDDALALDWEEAGAPAAFAPDSQGFGTTLIDFMVERAFSGTITRQFDRTGFSCRIVIPIDRITTTHTAEAA